MERILRNVNIIDGSGKPAFLGSVGMQRGKLVLLASDTQADAGEIIDCTGLTAAPGFIDAHSHGDLTLRSRFGALAKLNQGITTQLAGQCGYSMFPCDPAQQESFLRFVSGIVAQPEPPESLLTLSDPETYFAWLDALDPPVHTRCLLGHGALRLSVMGYADRVPEKVELKRMCSVLRRAMRSGALGLSLGLEYAPSCYARDDELLALLAVVRDEGGYVAMHPRDEFDDCTEARAESLRLAKSARVPLNLSHVKSAGKRNHGRVHEILRMAEEAAEDGLPVVMDCYPYTAGSTSLNVRIPARYLSHGLPGLVQALGDPALRRAMREEMEQAHFTETYLENSGNGAGIFITSCPVNHDAEGMFLTEYAAKRAVDPYDAFFDILLENGGLGIAVYFHMCEDDVVDTLLHPLTVLGTDGLLGREGENMHPRMFGSTARLYNLLVNERRCLTPEQGIRKMTGLTADLFHLDGIGYLRDGYDADVVLLDLAQFRDRATYLQSTALCDGVKAVFSCGKAVYREGGLV